jgi:DNA-binding transcriptional LysR family regulator
MELKEIDYILTIAECGSISKAADKLLMTQPSLSQFLQQFESSLGCQLFLRTTRGVVLTAAGEAFIEDARKIQSIYREAQTKLRDINDVKGGTVRLGISTSGPRNFSRPSWRSSIPCIRTWPSRSRNWTLFLWRPASWRAVWTWGS